MIAEKLSDSHVSLVDLNDNKMPDLTAFDAYILGTPIYAGNPQKAMQHFCNKNADVLTQKPLALFVCGMEENGDKQQQELANAFPENVCQKAVSKQFLGGEFLFEKMNFFEKMIIKKIAKTDKNVSAIKEENIDKLVSEFQQK